MSEQITNNILMVRPANFSYNEETASSNAFQTKATKLSKNEVKNLAIKEFDLFVDKLRSVGVNVIVAQDSDLPEKPDAVFPNNWATYHENNIVITYPMHAKIRRLERNKDILQVVENQFNIVQTIPLEHYENLEKYLEGTGSLIFDRPNKLIYACLSPRTDEDVLDKLCELLDYQKIVFHSVDAQGKAIYHTNVMMALGETFVVICLDTVRDANERKKLIQIFNKTDKDIIEISLDQMMHFAGNMLQVKGTDANYLVMSQAAYDSLTQMQIDDIENYTEILYSDIATIETFGGGSARCMMAEIFLSKK